VRILRVFEIFRLHRLLLTCAVYFRHIYAIFLGYFVLSIVNPNAVFEVNIATTHSFHVLVAVARETLNLQRL